MNKSSNAAHRLLGSNPGFWRLALTTAALLVISVAGMAQEITSAIRGTVTAPDGSAVTGAAITVTDTRTATTQSVSTNASGVFNVSGLRIGGPYQVYIATPDYTNQTVTDIYVALGDTHTFTVSLAPDQIEEIIVTAEQIGAVQVAIGPSTTFTLEDLRNAPAINRDITDVVKMDSRIYVNEAGNRGDEIYCGGAHNRFNSLTIDGVRMNDQFGLNSNGYPTARQPFSYDAIQQVAVEMAPFDVQYGGFTACSINAVTKSGTNEFSGSAFYDYTDDSMKGDKLDGNSVDIGTFDEKRYGFSLGGPIIQDKLFFFGAYEKLEGFDLFQRGPRDSASAATQVQGVSQAQLDRIADIANRVYGYDPGPVVQSLPVEDEKFLLRLDYDVNQDHRLAYTYMWNDGFNIAESDGDADEFEFSKHYYERGAEIKSHAMQWFANWTENFNTEFRFSRIELDNRQINIGDQDFGEVQIRTFDPVSGARTTVYLGADDSRHNNKLKWDQDSYKLSGSYNLGDHTISGGFERDELLVFNLFIQDSQGEFEFERGCNSGDPDGCIDQFELGQPDDMTYRNHPSLVAANGAVTWGYEINTLYLQDEFPLADGDITVVAGVRYDYYTSDDVPMENPNFEARNGYSNALNFDGVSLLQPRLGLHWDVTDTVSLHGGVGLYSGGNPNVWLSNNYGNDGITLVSTKDGYWNGGTGTETLLPGDPGGLTSVPNDGDGRAIWNVPQRMADSVSSGTTNIGVNALDPNFNVPSAWKFALGGTWTFDAGFLGDDYVLGADYLFTTMDDAAIIVDSTLEQIGTAPDGRPLYTSIDRSDPDCAISPTDPNCGNRRFNQDFILTNTIEGDNKQQSFSLSLSKSHDFGLDWTIGYTFNKSEDVSPMTSFVAFSNFVGLATSDPNNPGAATSNYQVPNRFAMRLSYRKAFWGDNETKFTLFGSRTQGRPFSYTFDDEGGVFGDNLDGRHLLYVPTGPNDPNVVFDPAFDQAAFFAFINSSGLDRYAGGIAPRNEFDSDWWSRFDIRIEQEFPGFGEGHNFAAFLMVENIGNLLNDSWGVQNDAGRTRIKSIVALDSITNGQYVFEEYFPPQVQVVEANSSLWQVRFGVRYDF